MAFITAKWQYCVEGRAGHIVLYYREVSTGDGLQSAKFIIKYEYCSALNHSDSKVLSDNMSKNESPNVDVSNIPSHNLCHL
jgi:hypothetical protein